LRVDRHRPLDLPRVPANLLAPVVEDLVLWHPGLERRKRVPHVGVLGGQLQRHLLAGAADEDGDLAVSVRLAKLAKPLLDPGQRVAKLPQAIGRVPELDPVLLVVAGEPAGADAQDGPTVAHLVQRPDLVGVELRVAVADRGDEGAELGALVLDRHAGEDRRARIVDTVGVAVERVHVVPDEGAVGTHRRGVAVGLADPVDGAVLRVDLVAAPESPHQETGTCAAGARVTAPPAAEPTSAAYFAITPVA